ncbi:hypothetical protein Pla8534_40860 [Lignipirellula cremea]|uniref:Uncharacterized protein n=2 Tax=Lignipirellula cremea TaxID=2528010 RepID=A0A518DWQ9_9BACT|nr:hypothetical protein Pla8534_40860 [Lignipirellula cremea]
MNWGVSGVSFSREGWPERSIPPAILLPSRGGEPLRLDVTSPAHPRGTGQSWPAEAEVSSQQGSGRIPLAAAWTGRRLADSCTWRWESPEEQAVRCKPLDAIAEGIAQLSVLIGGVNPVSVVVPNDFRQTEQQRVLDACRKYNANVSLIWLPIAAGLGWLDANRHELQSPANPQCRAQRLLVCHCDWGQVEISFLELVPWPEANPTSYLPARKRPNREDIIPGTGWRSAATLEKATDAEIAATWSQMFMQPWRQQFHQINAINHRHLELLHALQKWEVNHSPPSAIEDKLADCIARSVDDVVGVIVVGDWADVLDLARLRSKLAAPAVVVQLSGKEAETYLASGAAIYQAACLRNEICYLDTLPKLELFVERNGEFVWHPLLQSDNRYVHGGELWRSPDPIDVAARRGEEQVRLVVWHEEFEGVRELVANLREPAEKRLPGQLQVAATPAQGNAVLTIELASDAAIHRQRITANWRKMRTLTNDKGVPVDRETYLKNQPRAFPELLPRFSSGARWAFVRDALRELATNKELSWEHLAKCPTRKLNTLKNLVSQKDQNEAGVDRTAIGSDHAAPTGEAILKAFSSACLEYWRREKGNFGDNQKLEYVIRTLGYISVDDQELSEWLIECLTNRTVDRKARAAAVHACGHCLRNPHDLSTFILAVFEMCPNAVVSRNTNSLKSVSQALRYRAVATQEVTDEQAVNIFEECLNIFEHEMVSARGRTFAFRWSALIAGYMLRRRSYSADFLPPDGELAKQAKELFNRAISLYQRGKLQPIGGTVDTPAAIQQLIDYIDRRGVGPLLLSGE